MKNKDFSWDSQSPLNDELIDESALPQRFALTAPQVVMKTGSKVILLVDPHVAGTWETWMFPYASLILTLDQVKAKCINDHIEKLDVLRLSSRSTFRDLSVALRQLRAVFSSDYSAAIRSGVNNVLPQLQDGWSSETFYENYSLKFSKTSNSYTAYDFDYCINRVINIDLQLPHVWISPNALQTHLAQSQSFEGRPVSSNVIEALPAVLHAIGS